MYFIAILVAYVLERHRGIFPNIQRDQWFFRLRDFCKPWMTRLGIPALWQALLIIAVPCVLLVQVEDSIDGMAFGLPTLVLLVTVLVYSLGRGDIEAQLEHYLDHWRSGDLQSAWHVAQGFSPTSKVVDAATAEQLQHYAGEALLYRIFERWFCVVFWFALIGAWAALAYRLARLYGKPADPDTQSGQLAPLVAAMEWLPARLLALSFALAGNFSTTLACWREQVSQGAGSTRVLHNCALAALVGDSASQGAYDPGVEAPAGGMLQAGSQIKGLQSLLQRTAVAWLLLMALGVLLVD